MRVPPRPQHWPGLGLAVALAATILVSLAGPGVVLAVTGQDVTALATSSYGMTCLPSGADEQCTGAPPDARWIALISPATGTLTDLRTDVDATNYANDTQSAGWLAAMHGLACGSKSAAGSFATQLWAMTKDGTLGPTTVGSCTTTGSRTTPPTGGVPVYDMTSKVTAKPTPTPTPKKTAKPTSKPTPSPSASASIEPSPTVEPSPTAPPTPAPSPSVVPAAGPPTPAPTTPPGGSGGGAPPQPPTFASAVLGVADVATDPTSIGLSAALVLILLLFMGFAAELFNDTVENNYDVIAGWFRHRRLGRLARLNRWVADRARLGVLAFVALTALVSSFSDPAFGVSLASFAEFLGFFVGLVVVLASFKLPPMLAHRRRTGELGRLRPLPWALVIAALFVLVSRVGNLQPGYLYGIVLGAVFTRDVSEREEGRETLYGSAWTLAAAVLGWLGLRWVGGLGLGPTEPFGILASTAFAAILVSGMEATAFGLMPLHFMPGFAVYRYSRFAWALLFGLSVFAFVHILIGPTSGYLSELTPKAFFAALGVFAGFGALSIGTWLYFRTRRPDDDLFRPQPAAE